MATRTKKVKAAEDKDCGFMTAFKELGLEKGINPEIIFDAIEDALVAAYKRNFNSAQNVRVNLDRITGSYHVYAIKTVVDEVEQQLFNSGRLAAAVDVDIAQREAAVVVVIRADAHAVRRIAR